MRCEEFEAIVFSGETPDEAQRAAMQEHARDCEACRVLMEQADVLSGSRELDAQVEPTQRFSDAWRRAVRMTPQAVGLKERASQWFKTAAGVMQSRRVVRTAAAAFCAVALIGVGAQMGGRSAGQSAANTMSLKGASRSRSVSYYAEEAEMESVSASYDAAPMMDKAAPADAGYGAAANGAEQGTERKILRSAQLELASEAFDETVEAVKARVLELGGQITYCDVRTSGDRHYADLQLSIPDEHLDAFLEGAQTLGEVTRRMDSMDDMTAVYMDNASRLESARAQKAQLDALYAEAEDMADIVAITDALFDVQQEIDSLEGSNRWIDERADNAQVSVAIEETLPGEDGFLARLGSSFVDGFKTIGSFFSSLVLFAAWALPWLALVGVLAAGAYGLGRLAAKRRK